MKKLFLSILVAGLLLSGNAYADDISIFNKWLLDNDNYELGKKVESEKCKSFDKGDINWYSNNCDQPSYKNNKKIKLYKSKWTLPEEANPNFETLLYYFYKYQHSHFLRDSATYSWGKYEIQPSSQYFKFQSELKEDKYLKKQMNKTALLSYLLYEDDQITVDVISPNNRFGNFVNNDTKLRSMSMGKTMVSYVMGHAICGGYINSVDSRLNDWPLVENTLYQNQKLIDLLNMAAGDQKYVNRSNFIDGREIDTQTIYSLMNKMTGLKKSEKRYNYNNLSPNLLFNYISFKAGDNFENLLKEIFQNKAKIKESVFFFRNYSQKDYGILDSMFFATRYDYLRIAKAMLDDWQNDTCVGKYLKTIYEHRISKRGFKQARDRGDSFHGTKSYAGFFHVDYLGMKNRKVMGMSGYGGNEIIIDFERSRILVIHSIHQNYNWKKIARSVIKKGK